jgi:PRTRC genetic system protein A
MTTTPFVTQLLASLPLPPPANALYEMILAGNGLFLRGHRHQLDVLFPILTTATQGLPALTPQITPHIPCIPSTLMTHMLDEAFTAWHAPDEPLESLFHFSYDTQWHLDIPDQVRTAVSVHPRDRDHCPSYQTCLVEIHSHHTMAAQFSHMDDDEETGFRIYGVCGNFHRQPQITFRIGLYGHFYAIPASLITELPPGLQDTFLLNTHPRV